MMTPPEVVTSQIQQSTAREGLDERSRQFDALMGLYRDALGQQQGAAGGMTNLVNSYQQAFGEAQAKNLARNQQMLGMADQVTGQRAADIRSDYAKQGANVFQNLARLGMSNTTVAPTMQLGVQREQQSALNRLSDEMLGTKLGVMGQFQHAAPPPEIYTSLIQAMAPNRSWPSFSGTM